VNLTSLERKPTREALAWRLSLILILGLMILSLIRLRTIKIRDLHDADDDPEDDPNCGNVEYVEHAEDSGPDEEGWSYSLCGGSVANSSWSITAGTPTKRQAPQAIAD
jgi:hypothetical protein